MTVDDWLAAACEDADRRGLPDLKPMLASLADATRMLRDGRWDNESAAGAAARPAGEPAPPASETAR
jgi:hypothetical protein